jgi:hypothetical protein
MGFDIYDPVQLKKLCNAIAWSDRKLEKYRANRLAAITQYVGSHYGDGGCTEKVPINLINAFTSIYLRRLSVSQLRALVTTRNRSFRAAAAEYTIAIDRQLEEIAPEEAINSAYLEAMFGLGMVQVGLSGDDITIDSIGADDMILDLAGKTFGDLGYIGHKFRPELDWARENEDFDGKMRKELKVSQMFSSDSESQSDKHAQRIMLGHTKGAEEFLDRVDLMQIYLPSEKLVVTLADGKTDKPLSVKEWKGPERNPLGMYRVLGFTKVPGNLLPIPPVSLWLDLHESANRLANKAIRQAERQKTILAVQRKATADGQKVVDYSDGDAITVDHPDGINEFTTGGANQVTLGMVMWLRNMGSYVAGNADSLGGLAPATDTVGQDQMLLQQAGSQIDDMAQSAMDFASQVVEDIAYWTLNDPLLKMRLERKIEGTDLSFEFDFTADNVKGEFSDYTFRVDPYSVRRRTPQQRVQLVLSLLERMVAQYGPFMQQAGMTLDVEYLFKMVSQYSDSPEILDSIIFSAGEQHPDPAIMQELFNRMQTGKPKSSGPQPRSSQSSLVDTERAMMGKLIGAGDQAAV